METVRKVVEVIDTPIMTISGQKLIKRTEKILMPNGRYRYPVTYIEDTDDFRRVTEEELNNLRNPHKPLIELPL